MVTIVPEAAAHAADITALLDATFGADRFTKTSYRFREQVAPIDALAFVAFDADRMVGSISFWPVLLGEQAHAALLLGPLAVDPLRKNQGIGAALMARGLGEALLLGHRRVLLVGDHAYYARFGFAPASPLGITMPGEQPQRLLARALQSGAFEGVHGDVCRHSASAALSQAPVDQAAGQFGALQDGFHIDDHATRLHAAGEVVRA
ncbi:MAG: GNAT family N-acetyltransferase [Geminicoccaceae bacterium]